MISPAPRSAAYQRIADDLRRRIHAGLLAPGSPVGTEAALMHEYDVGIGTIRRALARLREQGLVEPAASGRVARVADRPPGIETVKLPRGGEMDFRLPTADEQVDLAIAPGVTVAAVTYGGRTQIYACDRTRFTFA